MRLRELRDLRGLTQSDVSSQIGIAQNTYSQYETGKREPDMATLVKLANYFGVSVDYLLGRSDSIKDEEGGIGHLLNDDRVHVRAFGGDRDEYVFSPEKWGAVKQILDAMAEEKENP